MAVSSPEEEGDKVFATTPGGKCNRRGVESETDRPKPHSSLAYLSTDLPRLFSLEQELGCYWAGAVAPASTPQFSLRHRQSYGVGNPTDSCSPTRRTTSAMEMVMKPATALPTTSRTAAEKKDTPMPPPIPATSVPLLPSVNGPGTPAPSCPSSRQQRLPVSHHHNANDTARVEQMQFLVEGDRRETPPGECIPFGTFDRSSIGLCESSINSKISVNSINGQNGPAQKCFGQKACMDSRTNFATDFATDFCKGSPRACLQGATIQVEAAADAENDDRVVCAEQRAIAAEESELTATVAALAVASEARVANEEAERLRVKSSDLSMLREAMLDLGDMLEKVAKRSGGEGVVEGDEGDGMD